MEIYKVFYGKFETVLMEAKDLQDAYISARIKFGKDVLVKDYKDCLQDELKEQQ